MSHRQLSTSPSYCCCCEPEFDPAQLSIINQGFSWFIDGTVLTVTTGRDGKIRVKMEQWSCPVPSRRQFYLPLTRTVPSRRENFSRCTLPSRSVEEISPYRPVPSTKPAPTVPSRLQNLPLPSRLVVKTCPYRAVQPSKPVPTVKSRGQNLSLPSRPAFIAVTPSRQDAVTAKMP